MNVYVYAGIAINYHRTRLAYQVDSIPSPPDHQDSDKRCSSSEVVTDDDTGKDGVYSNIRNFNTWDL